MEHRLRAAQKELADEQSRQSSVQMMDLVLVCSSDNWGDLVDVTQQPPLRPFWVQWLNRGKDRALSLGLSHQP